MFIVPHEFESITEEQWKSGRSRYRCATCRRDYGDLVHLPLLWPLVVTLEDVFVPDGAQLLLSAVAEYSDEDSRAQLTCWAYEAEAELMRN